MRTVRIEAPAKVNLFLRVLAREDSGYHQLETLFQALDLEDVVHVRPAGSGIELTVEGPEPCPPEDNLAYQAALAYRERAGIRQGVDIRLTKRVPAGGGLGGGSSDAAAVLRALDVLFEGELGAVALEEIAAGLGADVPYFLSPSPLALAWGRGDRLLPLPPLPPAPVLLASPGTAVETGRAFAALAEHRARAVRGRPVGVVRLSELRTWAQVAERAENAFHDPVFSLEPSLAELYEALVGTGPLITLLAGSGSSVFGVYRTVTTRNQAAEELGARFPSVTWLATETRSAMPAPVKGARPPVRD